jgi:pyroglutamyl-peptidase
MDMIMLKKHLVKKKMMLILLFVLLLSSFPCFHSEYNQINENIILITGFEPFDVYDVNPSELVALEMNNTMIQNYTIKGYVLPVDYETAPRKMKQLISLNDPELIISLGLAGKAETIRIENIAVNLRIDSEKQFPILTLQKVNKSGPWIQLSTFESSAIKDQIITQGIPVEFSYSAGLYLCNAILYETLLYEKDHGQMIPTGFLHLPMLDSQHADGMSLDTMVQAVTAAIQAHLH